MKIRFQRTGGFAGAAAARQVEIDTDSLPPSEARQAEGLVQKALAAPARPRPTPARDAFQYEIDVDDGGDRHSIRAGTTGLHEDVRALVQWLKSRAAPNA
ncbi:MAG: protealysin inhibitor emfourin [Isosphaeraceae bacterium]